MKKTVFSSVTLLIILLFVVLAGCSNSDTSGSSADNKPNKTDNKPNKTDNKPIKIVYPTYVVGSAIGADLLAEQVDEFNKEFEGKYNVVIESVPGDSQYIEKLKADLAANNLPVIFEVRDDPDLAEIIIQQEKFVDLKPYIDASPEWKSVMLESSIAFNTLDDGKVLSVPFAKDRYTGLFYNKELFAQAGIETFPKTWEGFWAAADQLKSHDITPISIHTRDTGWSAKLMFTAMIGGSTDGLAFLKESFPTDFNHPFIIEASGNLQKLFSYSTSDAIGGTYAIAANHFVNGNTAIMPNGPWMVDMFLDPNSTPEGFVDKVGVALYPGNVAMSNEGEENGYVVSNNYPEEVIEGAIEFLKFQQRPENVIKDVINLGGVAKNVEISEDDMNQQHRLHAELAELVHNEMEIVVPNYQTKWNSAVQNESIPRDLPLLADGVITPEQYVELLTEAAKGR